MGEEAPVVAVDGPAGAGKSTASRRLSLRLEYRYYDTGALYRALAWSAGKSGVGREGSDEALTALCRDLVLEFRKTGETGDDWRVWVNGRELTRELKGEEIGREASIISARPAVRDALLDLQRRQATPPGLVMEGRDVGTVVFPEAAVKFFITADAGERAKRRWLEMRRLGLKADLKSLEREIQARDERDRTREAAPLVQAEDAARIDTTQMNIEEVVENMVDITLQRLSARM